MGYDIYIGNSENEAAQSAHCVSIGQQSHKSIMRYVYESTCPLMLRFCVYVRDDRIANYELDDLAREIEYIKSEMRGDHCDQKVLDDLFDLVSLAKRENKGLYSICD
jgi:hypothetical protein